MGVGWENAYKLRMHVGCSMQNGANYKLSPLNSQKRLCGGLLSPPPNPSFAFHSSSLFALLSLFILFPLSITLCVALSLSVYLFFSISPPLTHNQKRRRRGGTATALIFSLSLTFSPLFFVCILERGENWIQLLCQTLSQEKEINYDHIYIYISI